MGNGGSRNAADFKAYAKFFLVASSESEVIGTWEEALKTESNSDTAITLGQWLNLWGKLCYGSAGISDFPCWVQLLPTIFFKVMDKQSKFFTSFC